MGPGILLKVILAQTHTGTAQLSSHFVITRVSLADAWQARALSQDRTPSLLPWPESSLLDSANDHPLHQSQ